MIFAPPYNLNRMKVYSKLLLSEASNLKVLSMSDFLLAINYHDNIFLEKHESSQVIFTLFFFCHLFYLSLLHAKFTKTIMSWSRGLQVNLRYILLTMEF